MTALLGLVEESHKISCSEPLPADPIGQRLCQTFGRYPWNFICATLPDDATAKVDWTTITAYPLRPRVLWNYWQDAHQLVGVRFNHTTLYGLLDLDAGSDYCTAAGVAQIRAALETIGITRTLLLHSSWSGGLHLYIPFAEPVNTFNLAVALKECLRAQGFRIQAGQLEIFPNVKAYGVQTIIEYAAHRLPLQPSSGSFLLDDDLNPIGNSLAQFFLLWDRAASHQDMDALYHGMKIGRDNHRKKPRCRSHPVDSWRHDLDIEITEGWTAHGQTNRLLKTIACYGRVFEGLQGQDLINYTLRMALNCPGYKQYCRHQHEIERKVTAWARAVEGYYWPLGTTPSRDTHPSQNNRVSFNQQQAEAAQNRIQAAYAQLAQTGALPEQITARAKAIAQAAQVSQQTLYKNLSLWHPQHQQGVIDVAASLSAPEEVTLDAGSQSSEPPENKELHPLENNMKCRALCAGDLGSDLKSFSPDRGVRGETTGFPQEVDPAAYDSDLHDQLQQQIRGLEWTWPVVSQFIADQFEGKRWFELTDGERLLLLYRLRVLDRPETSEEVDVATPASSPTQLIEKTG